jgi:hypothetical protein
MLSAISMSEAKECIPYSIYKSLFLNPEAELNYAVRSQKADSSCGENMGEGIPVSSA